MYKNVKKIGLGILFGLLLVNYSASGISEKSLMISSAGTGAAVGALFGGLIYAASDDKVTSVIAGVIASSLVWWGLDAGLSDLTPASRIKLANAIISKIESDWLLKRDFLSAGELEIYASRNMGETFTWVLLRSNIKAMRESLDNALLLVDPLRDDLVAKDIVICKQITLKINELIVILDGIVHVVDFSEAVSIVRDAEKDFLVVCDITSKEALASYAKQKYGTSWSLVLFFNRCESLGQGLKNALNLLHKAFDASISLDMKHQCGPLMLRCMKLISGFELKGSIAKQNSVYELQEALYKQNQESAQLKQDLLRYEASLCASQYRVQVLEGQVRDLRWRAPYYVYYNH